MNTRQQAPVDAVGNQKMKDFDSWDNKHRHRGTMAGGTHACEGKTSIIAHQTYLDHGTRVRHHELLGLCAVGGSRSNKCYQHASHAMCRTGLISPAHRTMANNERRWWHAQQICTLHCCHWHWKMEMAMWAVNADSMHMGSPMWHSDANRVHIKISQ
jgi:hypothetical protein